MDNTAIDKYFSIDPESPDVQEAYVELRLGGRAMAQIINKLMVESPSKADILGRLFRIVVDAELAIRMDGVSTIRPMIVRH